MSWPEVVLVAVNSFQLVALTWIASRQQQVKNDLTNINGKLNGH